MHNRSKHHSVVLFLFFVLATGFAVQDLAFGQTATSGAVVGSVSDPSGAAVPGAGVQLLNTSTNAALTQSTNSAGEYTFSNVAPGDYKLTVTATGFRTSTVQKLTVEVNKSTSAPIHLELGSQNQVVEVTATAAVQLQTQDAQIGNVLSTENILRLPTLQRNATELMNLQPGVVAGGNNLTMRVSGAIDDQNTVTLDGIDITQNLVATGTSIPTPADSVEELRVTVANPSATLTRGSGGQMTLVGRRGTNQFHGALYEYFQNSDLNSNTWDNNRVGAKKAAIHDNRYGGRLGGPLQKDKTFFFANYEGRRFASVYQTTRTVPTASLRQGIVEFQGPSGIEQFNLKTAAVCGTSGNAPCDPRGIGLDPSVAAQFADMPLPNTPGGDGLNTGGYFVNFPTPIKTDYGVMRLDHVFSDRLTLNTSFTYYRIDQLATSDVSILNGKATSAETSPERAIVPTAQLTWQITPSLLNVTRLGWVRDTMQGNATTPTQAAGILNIPGSQTADGPIALLVGSGVSAFIDSPIDMDTQRARFQASWLQDRQLYDDMTKVWGKHTTQFGFSLNELPFTHARADKVLGSITSLVAQIDGDQTYLTSFTQADRPLSCSSTVTASCLPSSQLTNWDRYYASLLGLVDNVSVLAVRNSNLQPQPLGTLLRDVTNQWAPYFYAQDSWRIRPELTLYYGLSYGWQTSPTEQNNLQTVMINAATGQEITSSFMQQKEQAALQGQIYNPTFGFATVGASHLSVYHVDYGAVGPHVAAAWQPSFQNGIARKLLGDRKSVIRGGFAVVFDRGNQVQSVEIPMLGIGFDQNAIVQAPLCNATGAGGVGCNAAAGASNYGLSSFRVGIDGTLPLPTATAATSPIIPAPGAETLSFQVDPNFKTGRSYNIDFSYQRELPGGIIMEMAYIGRMSRDLPQSVNVNSAPYMFVDSTSKQSFAQAYDAVANALRGGVTAANVPVQPWFENQFPGLAAANKTSSATAYVVSKNLSNFVNGAVGNMFLNLDTYRRSLGLQAYDSDQAQVEVLRGYVGQANYNAGVLTLTKRMSHGFMVTGNYTYSKALDDGLSNQNNAGVFSNSFDPNVQYGPSSYDRRHVVNIITQYDLPAGNGHMLHGNGFVNRIIGGWYTSGIFTAYSGLPIHVLEGNNVWGGGTSTIGANDYLIPTGALPSVGVDHGVSSSTCSNSIANTLVGSSVSGTGLDIFSNPGAAYCGFRYIELSTDGRTGSDNPLYGLPFWNLDMRLGKTTKITEKTVLGISADFFNIFNHQNFANPSLTYTSPSTFGVITSTYTPANRTNAARWIELGMRLDF
ncbi:MAG TPA: carboxypeptidase-like regulatory domain-containing protein [Bryobacteraceae bacterium]|nr:carboxypeptidase-like regulatory domain-containing protein [Bryobacteraceae bacterium]